MTSLQAFSTYTNDALLDETTRLAANERLATGALLAALGAC